MHLFLFIVWTAMVFLGAPFFLMMAVFMTDAPNSSLIPPLIFLAVGIAIAIGGYMFILKLGQTQSEDASQRAPADDIAREASAAAQETSLCSAAKEKPRQPKAAIAAPDTDAVSARQAQAALQAKLRLSFFRKLAVFALFIVGGLYAGVPLRDADRMIVPFLPYVPAAHFDAESAANFLIPLLATVALWVPRYSSYVWLQGLFYAEWLKLLMFLIVFLPLGGNGRSTMLSLCLGAAYFSGLHYLCKQWQTEPYREIFQVPIENKRAYQKKLALAMAVYCAAYGLLWHESKESTLPPYQKASVQSYKLKTGWEKETDFHTGADIDLSWDEKKLLVAFGKRKAEDAGVQIFSLGAENPAQSLQCSDAQIVRFMPDDNLLLVSKNTEQDEAVAFRIKVKDLATGGMRELFRETQNAPPKEIVYYTPGVSFSPDGKIFAVYQYAFGAWESETGKLLTHYPLDNHIELLEWLTEKSYLVLQRAGAELYLEELLPDGTVRRTKKEKILRDLQEKTQNDSTTIVFHRALDGRYVVISAKGKNREELDRERIFSFITVWDVEKEEKVFEQETDGIVCGAFLLADGKTIVTFEGFGTYLNSLHRMCFWDMETKRMIKRLRLTNADRTKKIRLSKDEKKAVLLGTSQISVIDLPEDLR